MMVRLSTFILASLTAGLVGLIFVVVAGAARQASLTRPQTIAASVAAGLGLWLAFVTELAEGGMLAVWTALPPRIPLLPTTLVVTFALLSRTETCRLLVAALPMWQPVALQTFRVGVEVALWRLYLEGYAPVQLTFEGRNFDGLAGLTAPLMALGLAIGWAGPRLTVAWNLLGLGLLANAIGTTPTSVPGPLHLVWGGEAFTAIADWPVVWIPALLAPTGVLLHVVSIRQAIARLAAQSCSP